MDSPDQNPAEETPPPPPDKDRVAAALVVYTSFARALNDAQRKHSLEQLPVAEQVSRSIRKVVEHLSVPDAGRDSAAAKHAKTLLKNTQTKTALALHLTSHASIERLATLNSMEAAVDSRLQLVMGALKPAELVLLQKSIHTQKREIQQDLRDTSSDQLESLLQALSPEKAATTKVTISKLAQMKPAARDRIRSSLNTLLEVLNRHKDGVVEVESKKSVPVEVEVVKEPQKPNA